MTKPTTHTSATKEIDTYDIATRKDKETIETSIVQNHWKIRSQREGLQTVMSSRHSIEENKAATIALQEDIFQFLGNYATGNIFELGVGIGRMTEELAKKAEYVTGCDLTPEMLEKAKQRLQSYDNVSLAQGRITDMPSNQYDLVFESIVLLHILDPQELRATADKMMELSDKIFLVEHTYEGPDFPISKYSILRETQEYRELFKPYDLVKQKEHSCAGDRFTMMLFEK